MLSNRLQANFFGCTKQHKYVQGYMLNLQKRMTLNSFYIGICLKNKTNRIETKCLETIGLETNFDERDKI